MQIRFLLLISLIVLSGCATKMNSGQQEAADAQSSQVTSEKTAGLTMSDVEVESFKLSEDRANNEGDEELDHIPVEVNPRVDMWVNYFQGRGRHHMERYLARSTRYEKIMKRVLRENGLPEDLFYIALIESGFSSSAVSHASAVGYWQFIRGTGKRYGLEISKLVDERRDPVLATQAAADYFKTLYEMFGSWYLAMASYNVGEGRVKKEVNRHETRDFWELSRKSRLPRETLDYIPKFIAAKMIGKDPEKYGFGEIDYLQPIEFDTIILEKPVNLRVMAEKMNFNYEDFKALNPKFKGEIAPLKSAGNQLVLRIPVGQKEIAIQAAAESVAESVMFIADVDTQEYKIRRGDNLAAVARRFRTSVAYLRDLNDLPRKKALKVGSVIYVPDRRPLNQRTGRVAKTKSVPTSALAAKTPAPAQQTGKYHVVQSGDNLTTIAKKYNTTVQALSRVNNLSRGRTLRIGMKLRLPQKSSPNEDQQVDYGTPMNATQKNRRFRIHIVQRGENLHEIAENYNVSITQIKKNNKIRNPSSLMAGVKLLIPRAEAK